MPTFAEFIAPFDPLEFRSRYYGQRPLHIRRPTGSAHNPLPWARLNQILDLGAHWTEETLKVLYKNRYALRENYCDLSAPADRGPARADPRKVQALLGLGASLVANHVHRVCPEVAAVNTMLQREFAAGSGANVYCSFGGVQAFGTHFDLHDVFAVQSEGEKLWHVYEARADNPVQPVPPGDEAERWLTGSRGKLLFEVLMQPGDVLYLPRGQYHDAITGSTASLHVTYCVKPATGLALFKLLEAALAGESDFRAHLPDAREPEALRAHLARLSERVVQCLVSPAFALDLRLHQQAFAGAPADYTLPHRTPPSFFSTVRRGQVLRRDGGFVAMVEGRELPLAGTHPAVTWLFGQRLFSFEDLAARHPGVDPAALREVLGALQRIGAIEATEMR